MPTTITGKLVRWTLDPAGEQRRDYVVVTLPFKQAHALFRPDYFNGGTGKGEQRKVVESHKKKLVREFAGHAYTPTPFGVGLSKKQQAECVVVDGDDVTITIEDGKYLKRTDGNHRDGSLLELLEKAREDGNESLASLIENAPVTTMIYLNGDPQEDFINLQSGKTVDANHLLTMKLRRKGLGEKLQGDMERALEIARLLTTTDASPFHTYIQLDTRGTAWLKFNSIAARGSSDLSTSLLGLARVAPSASPAWLASVVCAVSNALSLDENSGLTGEGMPLAHPREGVVGSACLLVGVAICVAYRLSLRPVEERDLGEEDLAAIVDAADKALGRPADDLSAAAKRRLIREFAISYFSGLGEEDGVTFHDNLPVGLLDSIPPSAYQSRPLPAAPRSR
jgi:hypothetical protein